MQQHHPYPYQNLSLKNIRGEKWKDVPGFEGYYQASSLGRVKSVDRTIPHPRWGSQFVAGRILSQSIAKNRNIKTGIPMIDLRVSFQVEGRSYYFNTRRVIYQTFIDRKLDYEKDGLYVINKDGDGYNNRATNLKVVTKSEKSQRVFKRNRQTSDYLRTADRSKWPKTWGGYVRRKPVQQYNLSGKLLASYESICAASRVTKFDEKSIIRVAKGKYKQWKGFVWKYIPNAKQTKK